MATTLPQKPVDGAQLRPIDDILRFWFEELTPKHWFSGGSKVDAAIVERFGHLIDQALKAELHPWRATALGRLAEIIILDQFTRNSFRGTAKAFAGDSAALVLSQEAVRGGALDTLTQNQQLFLLMPLMHAESQAIHAWARPLFERQNHPETMKSFEDHASVVAKFGRYPSRNQALGRKSTDDELAYLKEGKSWGQ